MTGQLYDGIPANVSSHLAAALSIASSTNATPIAVTTTAAHGLMTGDVVRVYAHTTNTTANGVFGIVVTGSTSFTLTGSTGTVVGGATGSVQPLTLGAQLTLPADGDPHAAASFVPGLSGLADRTAFLGSRLGAYKFVAAYEAFESTTSPSSFYTQVPTAITTWQPAIPLSAIPGYPLVLPSALVGDRIEISFTGTFGSGNAGFVGLTYATVSPGAAAPAASAYTLLAYTKQPFPVVSTTSPFQLAGSIPAFGAVADLYLSIGTYWPSLTSASFSLYYDAYMGAKLWRPTGMPQ